MLTELRQSVEQGVLRHVDLYFAEHLASLDPSINDKVLLCAALVSYQTGEGDVCLDLADVAGDYFLPGEHDGDPPIKVPGLDELRTSFHQSDIVGQPGDHSPLILDEQDRLYLGKYWWYEQQVAEALIHYAGTRDAHEDKQDKLRSTLDLIFPDSSGKETDWQKVAAAVAGLRGLSVISGGPGTGKTHTVTAILALLIELSQPHALRIGLAAPTGKAAARLTDAVRNAKQHIECTDDVRQQVPEEASTIHRLIGIRPGSPIPKYHADNPLHLDVLVLDEASMIDLALMAQLLAALPENARLIMLGDKDQLASVEPGSIFADICGDFTRPSYTESFHTELSTASGQSIACETSDYDFANTIALLQKSYRFTGDKGIGVLASRINAGDVEGSLAVLGSEQDAVVLQTVSEHEFEKMLSSIAVDAYSALFEMAGPLEALSQLNAFRILCALRGGISGVEQVNEGVEAALRRKGFIQEQGMHYMGRPIMVTTNDYGLGLFNGDIGILWPDPDADDVLRAWFLMPDGALKRVLPTSLPQHETAFAMTVHKSQGSEFDHVLLILPHKESPVLTRELVYTGVTRAKESVEIWSGEGVFASALAEKVKRVTGLRDRLHTSRSLLI